MKRYLLFVFVLVTSLPSWAVLNERDLGQSLTVLHAELKQAYIEQKEMMSRYQTMTKAQHEKMLSTMKQSSQVALMLYSQKSDYVFDMTYACHEATRLYSEATERQAPYTKMRRRLADEVERYDALILSLEMLPPSLVRPGAPGGAIGDSARRRPDSAERRAERKPPFQLDSLGQRNRKECLTYAKALRQYMLQMSRSIAQDSVNYARMSAQLSTLNEYALKRYHDIQQNIFRDTGTDYFTLLSRLPQTWKRAMQDFTEKYSMGGTFRKVRSEWRGPVIGGFVFTVLFYLVLAVLLSNLIVRMAMRHIRRLRTEEMAKMKPCVIITAGMIFFAVSVMLARGLVRQNFYVMASSLLVEYAWLLAAISFSLLIRLNGSQVKGGYRLYTPIAIMGLIIILFRIIFIPNNLVNLFFPPVVLLFTLWQWFTIRKESGTLPRSDYYYTQISLAVMIVSTVLGWYGRTLFSVEIFIWWLFQLTFIQTITLFYRLIDIYEERVLTRRLKLYRYRHNQKGAAKRGENITVTWLFDLIQMAVLPIGAVFSVLWSIYLAADVFDMSDTCMQVFLSPFLDINGLIKLSLLRLVVVSALFFLFKYASYAIKAFYRHFRLSRVARRSGSSQIRTNEVNLTLGYNMSAIIVWGLYFIVCLNILQIPKSGIGIVTAGLATGIGFAMKDLLNNFFYGMSLMAGRLRVGDWIECDGVQGRVESITYQSTQIITLDDCVMSFLNSTLFSKNFKNLTRNHSYELLKVPIGLSYGENIDRVRDVLSKELIKLQRKDEYGRYVIDPKHGVIVLMDSFGDSSVNIIVAVWVLVAKKVMFMGELKEAAYNALNAAGIDIPFPQQDVHLNVVKT